MDIKYCCCDILKEDMGDKRFISKVRDYIEEYNMLPLSSCVTIGVSGGADSLALLYAFSELKGEYGLKLQVVHVNHGLRPEAADEAEYVKGLCGKLSIPFYLKEADIAALAKELNLGIEEAGRKVRYEAFSEVTPEGGRIAVAHNMNDLSETMLFHLFRGTGPKGLAGIAPVRGNVIRPLLCVTRAEIEEYLKDLGVTYVTDKSNLTDEYTRNRIRHDIIPVAEAEVEQRAVPHMFETAEQLRLLNDFAEDYVENAFSGFGSMGRISGPVDGDCGSADRVSFDRTGFKVEHPYIRAMLVKKAIDTLVPGNRDITAAHIEAVTKIALAEGNKEANLPYGIRAHTEYDVLYLDRSVTERFPDTVPKIPGETVIPGVGTFRFTLVPRSELTEISRNEYTKCIDYDKITTPLLIRGRLPGDMISVTKTGAKKLKDFFIDQKVDRDLRNVIPLIASDNDIIWVVGMRLSEGYKITAETTKVLIIDYIKEDIC